MTSISFLNSRTNASSTSIGMFNFFTATCVPRQVPLNTYITNDQKGGKKKERKKKRAHTYLTKAAFAYPFSQNDL